MDPRVHRRPEPMSLSQYMKTLSAVLLFIVIAIYLAGCTTPDPGPVSELSPNKSTLRNQALPHAAWVGQEDTLTAVGIAPSAASVQADAITLSNGSTPVNLTVAEFTPGDINKPLRVSSVVGMYGEIEEITIPNKMTLKGVRFGVGDAIKDLGAAYVPFSETARKLAEEKKAITVAYYEMLKVIVPEVAKSAIQGAIDAIKGVETLKTNP